MKINCPKCNNECNQGDFYCSRCGCKLISDNSLTAKALKKIEKKVNVNPEKNSNISSETRNISIQNFSFKKNSSFDNILMNIIICTLIVSILLSIIVFTTFGKHDAKKLNLQYNNYIQNPERIPEFKEPKSFEELASNLISIENFLELFLKYSEESSDKLEQVFVSYLIEMDKLPHITSDTITSEIKACNKIDTFLGAKKCANRLNKEFSNSGYKAFANAKSVYLYPDYEFIRNKYSNYFSGDIKDYLKLRAKYNTPTVTGVNLNIKPKKLVDKILEFENLHNKTKNSFVRDITEEILFYDFKQLIFNPFIYASTTHEITHEFKNAYRYFILHKKSYFASIIISCLEKGRAYSEDNFKNDYPYKFFETTFDDNVINSNFLDIFAQLRKSIVHSGASSKFAYIFSLRENKWFKYDSSVPIQQDFYILSEPDENNNVSVYTNTFSLTDEVNISKNSSLFIVNGQLYVYNSGKLQISKIFFNGRNFTLRTLSYSDVTTLFPGIEIINIDSYSNYNIYLEKINKSSNFIILSRYSQGYEGYVLSSLKGDFTKLTLPVMFGINSSDDVVLSFHSSSIDPNRTSEASPTYKFIIHTKGQKQAGTDDAYYSQYDEKTANDSENSETYHPNIMPKLNNNDVEKENEKINENLLTPAPSRLIEDDKSESDND